MKLRGQEPVRVREVGGGEENERETDSQVDRENAPVEKNRAREEKLGWDRWEEKQIEMW